MNQPQGRALSRRLLLIGGGHAHLEVVRRLARRPDVAAVLVSPRRYAIYTGMFAGVIAGYYRLDEARIDLESLCRRSGVEFVLASATRIHAAEGEVECDDGVRIAFDVASIDTGAAPAMSEVPGAAAHADAVKPLERFLERWEELVAHASCAGRGIRCVVVGAGAAGVEIALAMRFRLQTGSPHSGAPVASVGSSVTLLSEHLLPGHGRVVRSKISTILLQRGVTFDSARVSGVTPGCVHLSHGRSRMADLIVFATSASAPEWIARTGLATDARGFVAVDEHLQSLSHARLFAAGDVASRLSNPVPKSGVYAVRAGPVLFVNLLAALERRPPSAVFNCKRHSLALIGSGDEHATLSYGRWGLSGHWVWRWKDFIDRRFVRRYSGTEWR